MTNTRIQIKKSNVTATPIDGSLLSSELAYSYVSDKLFIGSYDGTTSHMIGGQYVANTAFSAYDKANLANIIAVAAFDAANASSGGASIAAFDNSNTAFIRANAAMLTANAAYDKANSANILAFNTAASSNGWANLIGVYANTWANGVGTSANTFLLATLSGANTVATSAYDKANAANNLAFSRLPLTGGTISGDLTIQGNIFTSGTVSYANTQHLMVGDNIIILNADITEATAPSENAGIEINRGTSDNVALIWDEGTDQWKFTNDGTVYYRIATNTSVETAQTQAAAGMITANAAYDKANSANINAADASYLTTGTVPTGRLSGSYTGITGVGTLTAGAWNADVITVPYGGTGRITFANNGILFGNGENGIRTTLAGTEGQVLQSTNQGTPVFGMLDGGSF